MTTVVFASEMRQHTGGLAQTDIGATNYRQALRELSCKFPGLTNDEYLKFSIAIDGTIVHTPLLETFEEKSELVFIPKIAGG
jgi:molybdopterin converting factor small subunit